MTNEQYIDPKGTIRRQCCVCNRWIAQRGYTIYIYPHKDNNGKVCPCKLGKAKHLFLRS